MQKENFFSIPRNLIIFGTAMMLFSSPVLYLTIGEVIIDLQNLLGASIDSQSVSFDSTNPLIQGMQLISALGFLVICYGMWLRKNKR